MHHLRPAEGRRRRRQEVAATKPSDDGTARRRRRREGQAARGGDGVRLRRRAGHVVHARPDNKDWGSQWQLVTAGNCPFMHFPRATKVEMQTWCT
ncbi:uncharacterized protein LOC103650056 [Zea mays]|uniref:Uncharacterized protein n=1 Tax=Zea mays TaxID=4577 RepID=A0A1D6MRA1_MAIZE|nr:uncharacterized protein LOC103650056 [Zea mays]ONM31522.1 hypothetical protein ZEAMMB73_Zm00001d040545 [Zea mays]